jgi:hypothetical protein
MRSLSTRNDTLWSFFGILKSLIPKFPKGYIWGMPKDYLDAALLWETDCSCDHGQPLVIPTKKREWQELKTPSWCWLSKGSKVWYDSCGSSVKSMVEWHEPVRYEEYMPISDSRACQEKREKYLASRIFPADQDLTGTTMPEFAQLHFSAQTTVLRIHIPVKTGGITSSGCYIAPATISLPSGKDIGSIRVAEWVFNDKLEIQGEFILLSSKAGDCESDPDELPDETEHSTGIKEPNYNIMLIRWSDDDKIAYRVAWTKIARSAWEECETQKKRIVLG